MKLSFLVVSTLIGFTAFAQEAPRRSQLKFRSVNDTSFFRIVNGIVVNNDYKITAYNSVQYIRDKSDLTKLGIKTDKPIMLVNIEGFKIEDQVDSVLYSDPEFISKFTYPLNYQLPIALDGKLVLLENKDRLLSNVSLNKIERIEYQSSKRSEVFSDKTPFGVINVILKKND
ncbi:hypothetical protein [Pedobacter sp.]|uniref:hypothetical protein n=1 Tax=Pedobacter sp. TaxID=1411316 RepID=UPI003D7FA792